MSRVNEALIWISFFCRCSSPDNPRNGEKFPLLSVKLAFFDGGVCVRCDAITENARPKRGSFIRRP